MIPLELQRGVVKRLEEVFQNIQYEKPPNTGKNATVEPSVLREVQVFSQRLPVKEGKNDNHFPFVLVKLADGVQANRMSQHIVQIAIYVGVYDESFENQGHADVSLMLNKIIHTFQSSPVIDDMFQVDFDSPITWSISDEDTDPYFYGGISLHFEAPKVDRTDLEAFL